MKKEVLQLVFDSESEAITKAKELKNDNKTATYYIIHSRGKYYLENETPMIRNFESLVKKI